MSCCKDLLGDNTCVLVLIIVLIILCCNNDRSC